MPLSSFSRVGSPVEAAVGDSGSAGGALADESGGAAWLALAFPTDGPSYSLTSSASQGSPSSSSSGTPASVGRSRSSSAVKASGKDMLGGIDLLVFSRSEHTQT